MNPETYRYIYTRDKPMSIKIMGVVVALFSVMGLAYSPVFGIFMALGSIGILSYQPGVEVDFANRRYRLITALGPQSFGTWLPLPPLKCISVFKTQLVSSAFGRSGASVTSRQSVIQVNLATANNERIRLLETEDKEAAFAFAQQLAPKLDLQIWDATEREGKWL